MGLRGPQPKPSEIRLLEGVKTSRVKSTEPKPKKVSSIPQPPDWMCDTAKKYWIRAVDVLSEMRVLTEADLILLERYCDFLADWKHCRDFLKEKGQIWYPIYEGDEIDPATGRRVIKYLAEFPHVSKKLKASEHLLRIEMHFGMTPASRARITVEETGPLVIIPKEKESEFDDFEPPSDEIN